MNKEAFLIAFTLCPILSSCFNSTSIPSTGMSPTFKDLSLNLRMKYLHTLFRRRNIAQVHPNDEEYPWESVPNMEVKEFFKLVFDCLIKFQKMFEIRMLNFISTDKLRQYGDRMWSCRLLYIE